MAIHRSEERTLTRGKLYLLSRIEFVRWTGGDGGSMWNFFDDNGRYLGPDKNGVEPIVRILSSPEDRKAEK